MPKPLSKYPRPSELRGHVALVIKGDVFHARWADPAAPSGRRSKTTRVRVHQGAPLAWSVAADDPAIPLQRVAPRLALVPAPPRPAVASAGRSEGGRGPVPRSAGARAPALDRTVEEFREDLDISDDERVLDPAPAPVTEPAPVADPEPGAGLEAEERPVVQEPEPDRSGSGAPPADVPSLPDVAPTPVPREADERALALASHHRYLQTGAQPTPEELAAFAELGLWLDPPQIEAWCQAKGRQIPRDWALAAVLLLPTAVSLGATATGLRLLLPVPELALASAGVLALLTLALSWGLVGRYARPQARRALVVLAGVSIVTGFPAYYDAIAGRAEHDRSLDRAREAHAGVAARTVAVAQSRAAELEGAAAAAWTMAREEAAGTLGSGRRGVGPRARALEASAQDAERAAAAVVARAQRLVGLAHVEADATPSELYRSAQALWAAADPAQRGAQPRRDAFIEPAQESTFFLPYVRLTQPSPLAWVALMLAVGLDALVVYLGAGVVRSRSSASSVRRSARGLATLRRDIHWAHREIR